MSCQNDEKIEFNIALAGNPNVGKSVVFNILTGLSQTVGNWPGKTVKKAEGKTKFGKYTFKIVDLPGIYSLSTYSLEEIVSREYILQSNPDYIINIVDSNKLERNLFFTLQLMMLNRPMILCLNQYDLLKKRGYDIDVKKLEEILGIPVVPTVAVHNRGIHEILEKIIELEEKKEKVVPKDFNFGREVESKLSDIISYIRENYKEDVVPPRFTVLKLMEEDEAYRNSIDLSTEKGKKILSMSETAKSELEELHGEQISVIINSELFNISNEIDKDVEILKKEVKKQKLSDFFDHLTIHSFFGYILMILILIGVYVVIFQFGNWASGELDTLSQMLRPAAAAVLGGESSIFFKVIYDGLFNGLMLGAGGVLPYVVTFFFFIEILQDIGYLPRAAYLMDHFMHKIGVHGKTIIPVLLGFGCNVPAIAACSIMEDEREKKHAILITSFIPCSAVATIVLGLVAKFLGLQYALLLYVVNIAVLILIGRILTRIESSNEYDLIIELHDFRVPNFKTILKQTWNRSKEFVKIAMPLIIILGGAIQVMLDYNILQPINLIISPITVWFLGLPIGLGVYLFYGILRKELNLVLLEGFVISLGLTMTQYLTPIQMLIFTMVTMLYVPCLATFLTIKKEAGRKYARQVFWLQLLVAVLMAGLVRWTYVLMSIVMKGVANFWIIVVTFTIFFAVLIVLMIVFQKTNLIPGISARSKSRRDRLRKKSGSSDSIRKLEVLSFDSCGGACAGCGNFSCGHREKEKKIVTEEINSKSKIEK